MWVDVDTAVTVPVNVLALTDDTDMKTREVAIAYNAAGMDLVWNFQTAAGVTSQTAVTPTTAGVYDWTHSGDGMYKIEIPASGGGSINNDTEGTGWFTGICTGVLPWRGPFIGFRAAGLNDALMDSPYSTTRGLAGTALPNAAAEAAGGLYTRGTGAGQINQAANGQVDTNTTTWGGTAVASALVRGNVIQWTGTNVTTPDTAGSPKVTLTAGTGTGQISLSSGAVLLQATQTGVTIPTVTTVTNQVTANVAQISGDTTAADNLEAALDGTGGVTITAALTGAITGNITGNLSGSVGSVTGAVGSVTGAVGSVTGAVGSVTGAVGSVTGAVGSIASGGITTASFAAGAINAAAIAADAITDAKVAADVTIASVTGAVGSVTGAVGSVTAGVTVTTVNDKTGYRLSATGVDDVLDEVVEGSTTLRESIRLANAANGAKTDGAATTTFHTRDLADSKNRVTATVDADGNRTAVTRDLT